jgi:hypothetical protein
MFRQLLEHEVAGKELIYMQRWREILGKEWEACAFKPYQLQEQTDQLSILKIIPLMKIMNSAAPPARERVCVSCVPSVSTSCDNLGRSTQLRG